MRSAVRSALRLWPRRSRTLRNTISSVKRLMGRGINDIGNRSQLPYQLIDKPGMVTLQTVAGEKSPVEISA